MYKTEKAAAQALIDGTKADAAAALLKAQQAEQEVKRQRARLEQVEGIRGVHQKDIENLQKQIAENEAVRLNSIRKTREEKQDILLFSKSICSNDEWMILTKKDVDTKLRLNV